MHYHKCKYCDEILGEKEECYGGSATCQERAVCEVCGKEYGETNPDHHTYGTEWKSDKSSHWHECSCGAKEAEAAHTFTWITDKKAEAGVKGKKHQECTVCGYVGETEEIPALKVDVKETTGKSVTNVNPPSRVKIKKVRSPKKRTIKIKLKKIRGAAGYKVQISLSKKFKKGKKYKTRTYHTKKINFIKRKLKSKKIYYVRAKAYKVVNGKKIYSEKWSKYKKVKVK